MADTKPTELPEVRARVAPVADTKPTELPEVRAQVAPVADTKPTELPEVRARASAMPDTGPTEPTALPESRVPVSTNVPDTAPTELLDGGAIGGQLAPLPPVERTDPAPGPPAEGLRSPMMPFSAAASGSLPAMPSGPRRASLWGAIEYLVPVARAALARKRKAARLRAAVEADQRVLDGVLQELGRLVRELGMAGGAGLAEELERVAAEETRQQRAQRGLEEIAAERSGELVRREIEVRDLGEELKRRQAAHEAIGEQLRARNDERLALHVQRDAVQDEIRAVRRQGDEPSAELLSRQRDVDTKIEALAAPIARVEDELATARRAIDEQRGLEREAEQKHRRTLDAFEERRAEHERQIAGAERELSQRFVAIGTLVNLDRVRHERLEPLYARIDELRAAITGREATMARLEMELHAYDRRAVQRGLLVVGGGLALVVTVALILLVLLAR